MTIVGCDTPRRHFHSSYDSDRERASAADQLRTQHDEGRREDREQGRDRGNY
jgi:hypothetical protein